MVCITKWEFMSRLLGPLQLECDPFFGPRVVCKVSTKMGNSSAGSGSILTKNMEQEAKKKSWLSYHSSLHFWIFVFCLQIWFLKIVEVLGSRYDFVISFHQAIKEDKWWKYWREPEEEGGKKAFEYAWLDWGHGKKKWP